MQMINKMMTSYGGLPPAALCLTMAEELRDFGTNCHAKRTSRMVELLCRELGLDTEMRGAIVGAALLHDIGKFAVPLDVIQKTAPLTKEEVALLKTHSEKGYQVLAASNDAFLSFAADLAWTHHERHDGTGYPRGLAGDEIPLSARIFSVCDIYDALRQDRPYRRGIPHNKAINIVLVGDGRTSPDHFAPDVLMAFRAVMPKLKSIYDSGT